MDPKISFRTSAQKKKTKQNKTKQNKNKSKTKNKNKSKNKNKKQKQNKNKKKNPEYPDAAVSWLLHANHPASSDMCLKKIAPRVARLLH